VNSIYLSEELHFFII